MYQGEKDKDLRVKRQRQREIAKFSKISVNLVGLSVKIYL